MTTTTRPPAPAAPQPRTGGRRWPDPWAVLAVGVRVSLLLFAMALAGLILEHRTITGAPAWLKPAKFGLSAAVYLATLRWMIGQLPGHRRATAVISNVAVVVLLAELAWISLQVVRGTTSHYNVGSTFDAAAYYAMGTFISVLVFTTIAVGVRALRARGGDAGLAAGIRWGIGICVLGMLEAVLMVINSGWNDSGGHTVGAPDGGPGLPLTEWSTLHGDLRVGHFAGLHGLQVLPLLAWVLVRRTGLDERTRARLVAVAGTAYLGLVALLAWQALRGQALLRPDGTTLSALAVLLVVTVAGVAVVLLQRALTPHGTSRFNVPVGLVLQSGAAEGGPRVDHLRPPAPQGPDEQAVVEIGRALHGVGEPERLGQEAVAVVAGQAVERGGHVLRGEATR